jgi:HEAT repeat protein
MQPIKDDIKKISKDSQTIIGRLLSAAKNLKLYPASHPISKRIINASYIKLKEVLDELDFLTFSLAGNVLLINDKAAHVINKQTIDSFLTSLGTRKIGKITFLKGMDMDEFGGLVELLGTEPEDIDKQGGIKTFLSTRNIQHITIQGLSFGEAQEQKERGMRWKELLALISDSDDYVKNIAKDPQEFARILEGSLGEHGGKGEGGGEGEGEGGGWGGKIKQAVGNIAEKLFNMYEKTDIDTYAETMSRLILVLTPEMQKELLFSKPKIPFWEDVVNKVVDNITANELGDLIAEEAKKMQEAIIIGGTEGMEGTADIGAINIPADMGGVGGTGGLGSVSMGTSGTGAAGAGGAGAGAGGKGAGTGGAGTGAGGQGAGTGGAGTGAGGQGAGTGGAGTGAGGQGAGTGGIGTGTGGAGTTLFGSQGGSAESRLTAIDSFLSNVIDKNKRKKELIPAIRQSLQRAGVGQSSLSYLSGGKARKEFLEVIEKDLIRTGIDTDALIGIRDLIQKNAGIEELLKSLIDLLNNKNPSIRKNVINSFIDLTDKLILLARMELVKLILVAFAERLGRETEKEIFIAIIDALSVIGTKLIKEGKGILAEQIDDILNTFLKILENKAQLEAIVKALSHLGDLGDQKAFKQLIYAINRDVAYPFIAKEIVMKKGKVFPILLQSMKAIEDKITRIRVLSLLIDTAREVPDYAKYLKTYIDDPKWYVRRNISIVLGEVGGEQAIELLAQMAKDSDARVRIEIMESLGKIKAEDSEILLIDGLKDQDMAVVIRTLISLRKVGTPLSVFALKDLLDKQSLLKKEKILEVQERAIAVLCHIGGQDVLDTLRKVIFDKNILGRYKYNDRIRILAVEGLGRMESKSARNILVRAAYLKNQEVGKKAEDILKKSSLI